MKLTTEVYKGKQNNWIMFIAYIFQEDVMMEGQIIVINADTKEEIILEDVWEYEWDKIS